MNYELIEKLMKSKAFDKQLVKEEDGLDENNNQYMLLVNKMMVMQDKPHQVMITYLKDKDMYKFDSLFPVGSLLLTVTIHAEDLEKALCSLLGEIMYKETAIFHKMITDGQIKVVNNPESKVEAPQESKIIV